MICATIDTNGFLIETIPNAITGRCENLVVISIDEFAGAYSQITATEILYDFSWGFGAVLFFWFLGYCVSISQDLISKL